MPTTPAYTDAEAPQAAVTVSHCILVTAYHLLDRDEPYQDLSSDYFTKHQSSQAYQQRLIAQLERMATA